MKIRAEDLQAEIEKTLNEYKDLVYVVTEEGLSAAEKVLISNLKNDSPIGETKEYKKGWKGTGKKYKLLRFVGNTKTIKAKKRGEIPLSNVLEYSPKSKHRGRIKQTYNASIDQMTAAAISTIKREV